MDPFGILAGFVLARLALGGGAPKGQTPAPAWPLPPTIIRPPMVFTGSKPTPGIVPPVTPVGPVQTPVGPIQPPVDPNAAAAAAAAAIAAALAAAGQLQPPVQPPVTQPAQPAPVTQPAQPAPVTPPAKQNRIYTIASGDMAYAVGKRFTGLVKRQDDSWVWKELTQTNPLMSTDGAAPVPWEPGQDVVLPDSWTKTSPPGTGAKGPVTSLPTSVVGDNRTPAEAIQDIQDEAEDLEVGEDSRCL